MTTEVHDSRFSGFHAQSIEERITRVARWLDRPTADLATQLNSGGLSAADADRLVENVLGIYGLPFSVAPNFTIDGRDRLVPMVVEEPSVVAAAAHAARIVRSGGGFHTRVADPLMTCQIQLWVDEPDRAETLIEEQRARLLTMAADADPLLCQLGGGPKDLLVRRVMDEDGQLAFLVLHLVVDVRDAMGANAVNTMGEAISPALAEWTGGTVGLRILSNLADRRLVTATVDIPFPALTMRDYPAEEVARGIQQASRFAELDPYRAATHNKGIMNGVDAVLLATGNDWRAVEAGAHAFAARDGRYRPLCTWRIDAKENRLHGMLQMPLAVGIVGGATRIQANARLALDLMGIERAAELASVVASVGLANNLAALKALSTEGIQRGHMRLHRKSRHLAKD
jgi:hydroxymethylglutaryl-CoA reductase